MKKLLLSLSLFVSVFSANSQVLDTENFSAYTVGNIGTDVTGITPGQDDWLTFASTTAGGSNADFQIVNDGTPHDNVLQMTGSATATGNKFMWKADFASIWDFRDAGNDILEIEFDYFTGPVTTSKNTQRLIIYNADGTKILGGLLYATDTRIISGLAYYNNAGTPGNFSFNPTAANGGPVVLPANTWIRMGVGFNMTTGQILYKTSGGTTNLNMMVMGAAAGVAPDEIDLVVVAGAGNTVASVGKYDNYIVRAAATDSLLAVDQIATAESFSVFPNPASNVINVTNKNLVSINNVSFTDLNGRVVKQVSFSDVSNVQVNISELSSGVYMMNISSAEGNITKKIIKN